MVETTMKVTMGALLLLCGVQDALKKKVYLWIIIIGGILISFCIPFCNMNSIPDRVGGVAVGIFAVLTSLVTKGKIGMGDGLLLCATGLGLGFWGNLELFAIALLMAAVTSIILLMFRLADRKKSIPFVPFLLLSYVFLMMAELIP